ncbi:GNAT family N-acetyltransferase [Streptomyces noursei]|uniref:GNAT family N-acetyltransferase n=1 Tax=Streptomyces noursei TaxID=1971 RepID=UPI0030F1A10F
MRRLVGWAGLEWDEPGAELLLLLALTWRQRGLGEVLLRELVAAAQRDGAEEVWLHAASVDTPAAAAVLGLGVPVAVEDAAEAGGVTFTLPLTPVSGTPGTTAGPALTPRPRPAR